MPGDDRLAFDFGELVRPASLRGSQPRRKIALVLRVSGRARRIELGELLPKQSGDAAAVLRVQPIVRVAQGVHVTLAPIDIAARNVQQRNRARYIHVSRAAALDLRVARTIEKQRHPPCLEIEADEGPHVRPPQLENETGLRLDEVRVLVPFSYVRRGYPAATDGSRNVVEVGGAGDDPQLCTGGQGGQRCNREREDR